MPGSVVHTNSQFAKKAREGIMEFLLANHPLDCPICDQGGECDLQDQSMVYGSDRGRFHEVVGKRAVEDKNLGPLVKTTMTRCIHCTRCVRFAHEVAGAPELGTSGRGNDMQIGTYIEKMIDSEMSANIVDLCPVGALTSKPYAFNARPWELKKTESIDVLDGVGSAIRVDSRGVEVMRVLPRTNDDVNEEWINDKTRFAYDGLKTQRLTTPLIREGDRFYPATWEQAFGRIAHGLQDSGAKGDQIKAVVGHLADTESMVILKDIVNTLGSENLGVDQELGEQAPAHGVDIRSNYLFNSLIHNAEEADAVLLIGTNPRHEAAIINARLRKGYLHNGLDVAVIGHEFEGTFEYDHLGTDPKTVAEVLGGKGTHAWAKKLLNAKKPMIIVGSGIAEHGAAADVFKTVSSFVEKNKSKFLNEEWNGYNVLQRTASRAAAYDIGFAAPKSAGETTPKFIYLLAADEIQPKDIPQDAFVVYQGHHGDLGAQYADVCLPGSAYTEKGVTYVNTEGRAQLTRAAVPPPGAAREDWKILRALSEFLLDRQLPYDDLASVRDRLYDMSPSLVRYDLAETTSPDVALAGMKALSGAKASKGSSEPFKKVIDNFYMTDAISRASTTMAKCSRVFSERSTGTPAPPLEEAKAEAGLA